VDAEHAFNSKVRDFRVCGVRMLGEAQSGVLIGIAQSCEPLVESIKERRETGRNARTKEQEELLCALEENGYFETHRSHALNSAYLHVNSACNLHCAGCYSYEEDRNKQTELSCGEICGILYKLKSAGVCSLAISGGEPFLRKDMYDILRYAKAEINIPRIQVITNGTLPFQSYLSSLPYIDCLSVSIDGYDENSSFIRDRGIMPKVISNIERLKECVPINLIMTLHKRNIDLFMQYVLFSQKLGVSMNISLFTADSEDEALREYVLDDTDFEKLAHISDGLGGLPIMDSGIEGGLGCKESCGAGKSLVSIASNGDIYPCHMLQSKEYRLGNALADNILEAIRSGRLFGLTVDDIEACGQCEYRYLCGGGCRARSCAYYGGAVDQLDRCCPVYKGYFEKTIRDIAMSA